MILVSVDNTLCLKPYSNTRPWVYKIKALRACACVRGLVFLYHALRPVKFYVYILDNDFGHSVSHSID